MSEIETLQGELAFIRIKLMACLPERPPTDTKTPHMATMVTQEVHRLHALLRRHSIDDDYLVSFLRESSPENGIMTKPATNIHMRITLPDGTMAENVHIEGDHIRGLHVLTNGQRVQFTASHEVWAALRSRAVTVAFDA